MRDLMNVLLAVVFFGMFFTFLPQLIFIVIIVSCVVWILNVIRRSKPRSTNYGQGSSHQREEPLEDQTTYYETKGRINPDVIDAEYTETVEK